ncbi:60 kDa SS-A/Ro ribonucleoprotein [Phlyctochytrium planicorne]|nr:60 kDa SS-A/Ro ribonucleoprotein [Phlyctochytrium planicorne]
MNKSSNSTPSEEIPSTPVAGSQEEEEWIHVGEKSDKAEPESEPANDSLKSETQCSDSDKRKRNLPEIWEGPAEPQPASSESTTKKRKLREYTSALVADPKVDAATVEFLQLSERLMKVANEDEASSLIRCHHFAREHVPSNLLNSIKVWEALNEKMPMTAMIRNLGKMTNVGLLKPLSEQTLKVVEGLGNRDKLKEARIHPFNILVALEQYRSGEGFKSSLVWTPVPEIVAALEKAFHASFEFVEPTQKRFLLGIDVSGSMTWTAVGGSNIMCSAAAATMAMTFVRTELRTHTMDLGVTAANSLSKVLTKVTNLTFGAPDCAVPMTYALQHKLEVDVFIIFTDSETYAGKIHPAEALRMYRREMGIPAKLVVFGMASNGFTIADPKDAGMLDVCGFDAAAP